MASIRKRLERSPLRYLQVVAKQHQLPIAEMVNGKERAFSRAELVDAILAKISENRRASRAAKGLDW